MTLVKRLKTGLLNFRTLIANVPAFQAMTGAADESEALNHISLYDFDDGDVASLWRHAVVDLNPMSITKKSNTEWNAEQSGEVVLELEWEGARSDWLTFSTHVEDIVDGIMLLAGNGYIDLVHFECEEPWSYVNIRDTGDRNPFWFHRSVWSFSG